jgi:hypothetical protein
MSPFLDPADVTRLTGYKLASFQLRWCRENGVRAWLNGSGEVIVPRSAIDGVKVAGNDPAWNPDFSPLQKTG